MKQIRNSCKPRRFEHVFKIVLAASLFTLASGFVTTRAQKSPSWDAPEDAKKVQNPAKPSPSGLKQASQLFQENCVPCHGKTGAGDGPAGASLNPKPANLTDPKLIGPATDGELFWKMSNGRGPMPAWKDQLSDNQRWLLVNYIRTLGPKSGAAQ